MGQFYSREFDGDPYIDLMRALPERELVWWAQKVIWLAEGFTFVDHFARTYPRLFQHKCTRCNGAGVLTCPACAGTKVPLTHPARASLLPAQHALPRQPPLLGPAPSTAAASVAQPQPGLLSSPFAPNHASVPAGLGGSAGVEVVSPNGVVGLGAEECKVCGQGCNWDAESEWQERWADWESKLAYYDKVTGPLMDEWYEDVVNAGNLEEDTPQYEEDPPGPEVTGQWAHDARELAKDKKRFAALMKRFGHPYDADATLGYQIVDPTSTLGANVWNMAQAYNSTPPELNPHRTRHLEGPGGGDSNPAAVAEAALEAFDAEIAMEVAIMQNLQAAVTDQPKPHRFVATAGTVPCETCNGAAWCYALLPNTERMFGIERPLWTDTVARLAKYWSPTDARDARTGAVLPYGEHGLRSLLAAVERTDPLEALIGRPPETTGRYRSELELLVANPELKDARLSLKGGKAALQSYLDEEEERRERRRQGGQRGADSTELRGRDLAAVATPLG